MNEDQSEKVEQDGAHEEVARRPDSSSNPFDYPLVAPLFLLAMALWFGYDGWLNPDTKSVTFNQVLFFVFAVGFAWTLWMDLKLMRKAREKKEQANAVAEEPTDGE